MVKCLVVLQLVFVAATAHECIHEKIARTFPTIDLPPVEEEAQSEHVRQLQTAWRPMRIKVDFSNVPTTVSPVISEFFSKVIVPKVANYFTAMLNVTGPTIVPKLPSNVCGSYITVPSAYLTATTNTDFILFIRMNNETANYLAWATHCSRDGTTRRPNTGVVNINLRYVTVNHAAVEANFYTILHEVAHALVFSSGLYDYYPIGRANAITTQVVGTKTWTLIKSPGVLAEAKTYFGCSTILGVRLEDEGGSGSAGSHWEKNSMGNDFMTAIANGRPFVSRISYHLFNDVGWYKANFTNAEKFFWGQGRGCTFLSTPSATFPEFNVGSLLYSCTADFIAKSFSQVNPFSNGIKLWDYFGRQVCNNGDSDNFNWWFGTNVFESIGTNSRCFNIQYYTSSTATTFSKYASCLKSSCVSGKAVFQSGTTSYTCTSTGQTFRVSPNFAVVCPNAAEFCKFVGQRPASDCTGHGTYLTGGGCRCEYPFTGATCSTLGSCSMGESAALCALIKPPTLKALSALVQTSPAVPIIGIQFSSNSKFFEPVGISPASPTK